MIPSNPLSAQLKQSVSAKYVVGTTGNREMSAIDTVPFLPAISILSSGRKTKSIGLFKPSIKRSLLNPVGSATLFATAAFATLPKVDSRTAAAAAAIHVGARVCGFMANLAPTGIIIQQIKVVCVVRTCSASLTYSGSKHQCLSYLEEMLWWASRGGEEGGQVNKCENPETFNP